MKARKTTIGYLVNLLVMFSEASDVNVKNMTKGIHSIDNHPLTVQSGRYKLLPTRYYVLQLICSG